MDIPQLEQIRAWEAGELYPEHDIFSFGHGFGTALVKAFGNMEARFEAIAEALVSLDKYLLVMRNAFPERYKCRLCDADPEEDHRPDCELQVEGAKLDELALGLLKQQL